MKRIVAFLVVVIFVFLCCSCDVGIGPGMNDWHYILPNEYEIIHISPSDIVCVTRKPGYSNAFVVERQVTEFCFNERYIGLKRARPLEDSPREFDVANPEYYLVDTMSGDVGGPFDEEMYIMEIDKLQIDNMYKWISTSPAPDGAIFPGRTKEHTGEYTGDG